MTRTMRKTGRGDRHCRRHSIRGVHTPQLNIASCGVGAAGCILVL